MSVTPGDEQILRARALQLALPPASYDVADKGEQLLIFVRAERRYALDVRFVREIVPLGTYAELPFAPPACLGLASARGELFALFDLPALEAEAPRSTNPKLMVLCGEDQLELALAVDDAIELVETLPVLPPPEGGSGLFLGADPRGFLVVDGAALLSDPRLRMDPSQQEIVP